MDTDKQVDVGDIVKIWNDDKTTLGKVTSVTADGVSVFRDSGDVWYASADYMIEKLGTLS